MSKPLFFYKQSCRHSQTTLFRLAKHGLATSFVLVDVDQYMDMLPRSVDRVPAIMFPGYEHPYVNEQLQEYVDALVTRASPEPDAISANVGVAVGDGLLESCMYQGQDPTGIRDGFTLIGEGDRSLMPSEDFQFANQTDNRQPRQTTEYDRLVQQRKREDDMFKQEQDMRATR